MEALVNLIIQNSKAQPKAMNPRQVFFQEFDRALQAANAGASVPGWETLLNHLEVCSRAAGLSATDWAQRKSTLLWTAAQAA